MSTDTNVIDAATAESVLIKDRDDLAVAKNRTSAATSYLNALVVEIRPAGILDVGEMAEAVGRDRNFIDTVWSNRNDKPATGKQTRVPLADVSDATRKAAVESLADAAGKLRSAVDAETVAREIRNRNVALVYGAAINGFGPSAIARAANIDRNHVGRIARDAKIASVWRKPGTSRNQWTVSK